jgi:phosphoribosylglycinamide formyltransferase 1
VAQPLVAKRVAVLLSGSGSNLQALIEAARAPDYPAQIALVVSNEPDAYGLERAKAAGIAAVVVAHKDYQSREDFEAGLQTCLQAHAIDVICLAGFMRILTPHFVEAWRGRMLNIHPSLLPSFKGLHTHARALEAGCKIHGCTVHLVEPALDEGPILAQAAVAVLPQDSVESLAARVLVQEHQLYPQALRAFCEGQLRIEGHRVHFALQQKIAAQPMFVL